MNNYLAVEREGERNSRVGDVHKAADDVTWEVGELSESVSK